MIASALAWIAGTKAGRIVAALAAAVLAIVAALLTGRREGRLAERAERAIDTINTLEKVNEADAEYRAAGPVKRLRDGEF